MTAHPSPSVRYASPLFISTKSKIPLLELDITVRELVRPFFLNVMHKDVLIDELVYHQPHARCVLQLHVFVVDKVCRACVCHRRKITGLYLVPILYNLGVFLVDVCLYCKRSIL